MTIEKMRKDGYDHWTTPGGEIAVFSPNQVKSATDNDGSWDHPTLVRSRGGLSLDDVYGVRTRDVVEQIKLRRHEYDYDPQKRHVCDMVEEAFAKAQADPSGRQVAAARPEGSPRRSR